MHLCPTAAARPSVKPIPWIFHRQTPCNFARYASGAITNQGMVDPKAAKSLGCRRSIYRRYRNTRSAPAVNAPLFSNKLMRAIKAWSTSNEPFQDTCLTQGMVIARDYYRS